MAHKISFSVNVIECNAETFQNNYAEYIKAYRNDNYDNKVFFMEAPENVYDEIKKLEEEGITIM